MIMPSLTPSGGNDNVSTPQYLADLIVAHFRPAGHVIEPCCGVELQPFVSALGRHHRCSVESTDIRLPAGGDFLNGPNTFNRHWDWLVTNPPWSKLQAFLVRSLQVSDNIVFLALLPNWLQKAKLNAIDRAGFGIVEHLHLPDPDVPGWPRTGFQLGATWIRRGWTGGTHNNRTLVNLPRLTT